MFTLCPNPMMIQNAPLPPTRSNNQDQNTNANATPGMDFYLPRPDQPIAEFLYQLTKMLTVESKDIIEWANARIKVHDPPKLAEEVLHKYFRHSKYASFQRQLNYFGFRKLAGKAKMSPCSYINDEATEDLRSLLFIKRKTSGNSSKKNGSTSKPKKSIGPSSVTSNENSGTDKVCKRKSNDESTSTITDNASKRSRETNFNLTPNNLESSKKGNNLHPLSMPMPFYLPTKRSNPNFDSMKKTESITNSGVNTTPVVMSDALISMDYSSASNPINTTEINGIQNNFISTTIQPQEMGSTGTVPKLPATLGEHYHFLSSNSLANLAQLNNTSHYTKPASTSLSTNITLNNTYTNNLASDTKNAQPIFSSSYIGVGPVKSPQIATDINYGKINTVLNYEMQNNGALFVDPGNYLPISNINTGIDNAVNKDGKLKKNQIESAESNIPKNSSFISVSELLRRDPSILDFSNMTYNSNFATDMEPTPLQEMQFPTIE